MKKIIMLKYAELNTKKDNINMFLKTLKNNIESKIKGFGSINYDKGRMFIYPDEEHFDFVLDICKCTFGIHEICIVYELSSTDIDYVSKCLIEVLGDYSFESFKVETKRSDKEYAMTSPEISKYLGGVVLKNFKDKKVSVTNPNMVIHVEIRKEHAYIYFAPIKGLGGYPIGSLGKGILMLSGGIDSPVAGYLAMKRGVKLEALYFESPPHTSVEAKNKVLSLAHTLSKYGSEINVHIIPFTEIQEAIYKNIPSDYMVTIMRRMMYRIATRMAYKNKCKIIINGESIGQVASQTLSNMSVINEVTVMPVIRPVACFDKLEIIDIAKKIGTYETSILPFEDCCTIFVPKHPVINPELEKCISYEKLIPYEELINKAIYDSKIERFSNQSDYSDLL